jgi:hypothetical protein
VIALVFGVLALTGRESGGGAASSGEAAGPTVTAKSTDSAAPPSPTVRVPTTATRTTPTLAVPSVGNDVVTVSAEVASDPLTPTVVDLVTRYVESINEKDFATYRSLFTAALQSTLDIDSLAEGYRSTHDSDVQLLQVGDSGDGRTAAQLGFVSTQDAVDGPDGLTCTVWAITLFLQPEAGRLAIGVAPSGYRAQYRAC